MTSKYRRDRSALPLALFLIGVSTLACVGGFVVVRAVVEWIT